MANRDEVKTPKQLVRVIPVAPPHRERRGRAWLIAIAITGAVILLAIAVAGGIR